MLMQHCSWSIIRVLEQTLHVADVFCFYLATHVCIRAYIADRQTLYWDELKQMGFTHTVYGEQIHCTVLRRNKNNTYFVAKKYILFLAHHIKAFGDFELC